VTPGLIYKRSLSKKIARFFQKHQIANLFQWNGQFGGKILGFFSSYLTMRMNEPYLDKAKAISAICCHQ
jgi:hypothetical protein